MRLTSELSRASCLSEEFYRCRPSREIRGRSALLRTHTLGPTSAISWASCPSEDSYSCRRSLEHTVLLRADNAYVAHVWQFAGPSVFGGLTPMWPTSEVSRASSFYRLIPMSPIAANS